jgi:hypothetical protein
MCDSNNFNDENNIKYHYEWHLADKQRRLTKDLPERKEYPYSPLTNVKKQKENNTKHCFE